MMSAIWIRRFALAGLLAGAAQGALAQEATGGEAQLNAGAYLAARAAGGASDFVAASDYFLQALQDDPGNAALYENALTSLVGMADMDRAISLSQDMVDAGINSQVAHMLLVMQAAVAEDWPSIVAAPAAGRGVGPLVDGLSTGWAHVGLGEMAEALAAFDTVIDAPGLRAFGLYHKGLALAVAGDFEAADAIFSMSPQDGMQQTRRVILAHAQVLSQLGRNPDAVALIDATFGNNLDPGLSDLRMRLSAGEPVPYRFVNNARQGLAEVYFSIGTALGGQTSETYMLMYARIVNLLDPSHVEAVLFTAQLLEDMAQFDLASAAYNMVPREDMAFHAAEMGRAAVLRRAGRADAAVEVLEQLTRTYPDLAVVHATLGDTLRGMQRFREANEAYSRALSLYDDADPARWFVLYTRGMTYHRLEDWAAAEADLRQSIAIKPGQPQVLNYLGYSMVERGENLDEALAMIEEAVRAQPQNGAVVDSLGWVQFRMGLFDDAVFHLERAAELLPIDPVINDHLGDAYWAVGRLNEARFQWQRALSFDPAEVDADRIRSKLEIGLDQVLAQEGAAPLRMAQDASNP